ncbi:MAG: endonuclease/exonuclease/phosphatase family protein [Burkholderiaceae bacterium]|nr:endonuclease/exonuclease/phosphatase family protein [Burkholderiaceae bacterium]
MRLRIATYNIHKGVSALAGSPRVRDLKKTMSLLAADVIFLQEVQGRHDWLATTRAEQWPSEAQYDYLAGDYHHSAYGKNAVYDYGHHGNALLSAYPIIAQSNQDISDHALEHRGVLHCTLQMPETRVHCYVVHLGLFEGSRRRQTQMLIDNVLHSAPGNSPIIIAGDFNDWGNHLSDALREALGVTEVFENRPLKEEGIASRISRLAGRTPKPQPARTFPAAFPCLPLDRIYVRGFRVESATVLHGRRWAKVSDHAPIVASLQME